ncbi:uncharacterized protein LOC112539187 [Tetranychus urticae]|uniref:Uncharacterized protein n=1 Tax=Tetranychus urticae TaxID=32264 RepID=T1KLP6_TETUR|nr:uncharacterized protein LOC112539187 [Tetranychus urticae]
MEEQNDKSTFQLEFLGEYHDIVIDWNDGKYKYKETQLLELLEPITGIPRQYNIGIRLYNNRNEGFAYHYTTKNASRSDAHNSVVSAATCDYIRNSEGRFHLTYWADFNPGFNQTYIFYTLVPKSLVPEGECCIHSCRHKNTKTFFNKIKDIINNDQLNVKIASLLTPNVGYLTHKREVTEIFKKFNVIQYFKSLCTVQYRQYDFDSKAVRIEFGETKLYLRTRG